MRQGNSLRGYIRQAVKRGRAMGMQLDFSEASVQALEGMLENLHREMALPSEEQIRSEALTFGCYLGEAMLRGGLAAKGYAWDLTEGRAHSKQRGGWADGAGQQGIQAAAERSGGQCIQLLHGGVDPG